MKNSNRVTTKTEASHSVSLSPSAPKLPKEQRGLKVPLAIHDISADNYSKMAPSIEFCQQLGWQNIDLMVIPKSKHLSLEERQNFTKFLNQAKTKGAKLWLHGLNHQADAQNLQRLKGKWVQKVCRNEAEFCGLPFKEAKHRYSLALETWRQLEVGEPEGFVPPTWHDERDFRNWLCSQGVLYETRFGVRIKEKTIWNVPLSLMDRPGLWELSKFVFTPLATLGFGRIVLHPFDFEGERANKTKAWLSEIAAKV